MIVPKVNSEGALRGIVERIPSLQVSGGNYPVDVEATVSTGWMTYKSFVVDEGREMSTDDTFIEDLTIDSTTQGLEGDLNTEFGSLDDLMQARPEMSVLYIPELKKNFYIRTLNGQEVDAYRSSITVGKGQNQSVNQRGMRAKLVVISLGNPDGSRMLTDKDVHMVQSWPSKILERIFDRSRKFNGLTDEDTDDEKGNS